MLTLVYIIIYLESLLIFLIIIVVVVCRNVVIRADFKLFVLSTKWASSFQGHSYSATQVRAHVVLYGMTHHCLVRDNYELYDHEKLSNNVRRGGYNFPEGSS